MPFDAASKVLRIVRSAARLALSVQPVFVFLKKEMLFVPLLIEKRVVVEKLTRAEKAARKVWLSRFEKFLIGDSTLHRLGFSTF